MLQATVAAAALLREANCDRPEAMEWLVPSNQRMPPSRVAQAVSLVITKQPAAR